MKDDFCNSHDDGESIGGPSAGFIVLTRMLNIAATVKDAEKVGGISLEIDGIHAPLQDWMDLCIDISNEMFSDHAKHPHITRPSYDRFFRKEANKEDLIFMKNIFLEMKYDLIQETNIAPGPLKGKDIGRFLKEMLTSGGNGAEILEAMSSDLGIPKDQIMEDINNQIDIADKYESDPSMGPPPEEHEEVIAEIDPENARMVSSGNARLGSLLDRPLPTAFAGSSDSELTFDYDGYPIKELQKLIDEIDMTLSAS